MAEADERPAMRGYLHALRDPRYAPLTALMVLVAIVCIAAGTWQILRFEGKVHDNDALRANAHRPTAPVTSVLPLVGRPAPAQDAVRYRTVTATGHYDAGHTAYVRLRTIAGRDGALELTPFVTRAGVLLVVRGLRYSLPDTNGPLTPPPSGRITITARVEPSEPNRDSTTAITQGQLLSINAPAQAAHLHAKVFDGYAELLPGQPGSRGSQLIAVPAPSLSNPAGGAVEPQHFAYIVQWYLFALLALAAPFAMVRSDRNELAANEPAPQQPLSDEQRRAAKLADRYGRIAPR
ncbi:MAG TPA: SURF1 family protein [Jatrophihabitans sp.]